MDIKLSLLSVLSIAYLFMYCGVGEVSLDRLSLDVAVSSSETTIGIHPTWAIWVPREVVYNHGAHGLAYGNVMLLGNHLRIDNRLVDHVSAHERMHLIQFRALGLLTWPAQFILNIEPDKNIVTNWNDPTQPGRTMWKPPSGWPFKWSFLTITIGGTR